MQNNAKKKMSMILNEIGLVISELSRSFNMGSVTHFTILGSCGSFSSASRDWNKSPGLALSSEIAFSWYFPPGFSSREFVNLDFVAVTRSCLQVKSTLFPRALACKTVQIYFSNKLLLKIILWTYIIHYFWVTTQSQLSKMGGCAATSSGRAQLTDALKTIGIKKAVQQLLSISKYSQLRYLSSLIQSQPLNSNNHPFNTRNPPNFNLNPSSSRFFLARNHPIPTGAKLLNLLP